MDRAPVSVIDAATNTASRSLFVTYARAYFAGSLLIAGRPQSRTVQRWRQGIVRITVEFSDGTKITARSDSFIPYSPDILPIITAAVDMTKAAYAKAPKKLVAFGNWLAKAATFVTPAPPLATAPEAAGGEELPPLTLACQAIRRWPGVPLWMRKELLVWQSMKALALPKSFFG